MTPQDITYSSSPRAQPIQNDAESDLVSISHGDLRLMADQAKSPSSLVGRLCSSPHPSTSCNLNLPDGPHKQELSKLSSPAEGKGWRKYKLFNNFEVPKWKPIALHTVFCIIAYPILELCVVIAREKSLFWTRFIVGVGCGVIGLGLGFSLLELGKPFLEAATWATVIHLSRAQDDLGIKLRDLAAASSDAASSFSAVRLLWARAGYWRTSRSVRKAYDRRFWTIYVSFFLLLTILAASISFKLGRLVDITATLTHQTRDYEEVGISGVNSAADIAKTEDVVTALKFNTFFLAWAPSTFSQSDKLPLVASFNYQDDKVYFAETTLSQLLPGGHGFGTFDDKFFNPSIAVENTPDPTTPVTRNALEPIDPGYMLRYPKWGARMHCVKLPDPDINLIPTDSSGSTVVFTPRQVLRDLFASFNLTFNETVFPRSTPEMLLPNDPLPKGLDPAAVAFSSVFGDHGGTLGLDAFQYTKSFIETPKSNKGLAMIEHALIRLNTTYAPQGKFLRLRNTSIPDASGDPTYMGYDSAICLHLFEPWIVETYNGTTGAPTTLNLIGPGNTIQDVDESTGDKEHRFGLPVTDSEVTREVVPYNLTGIFRPLFVNSMALVGKDAANNYVPSQTLLSLTDGVGMRGYTEFSLDRWGQYRGSALAMYLLPYFAGSGQLVARRYPDLVVASAFIHPHSMLSFLSGVLVVGLIAGFFVPKLPVGVKRRGFQLYSWLAMLHANELVCKETEVIGRNMELCDIEKCLGEARFRYVNLADAQRDEPVL